jgi:outer membrane receptor protein involved in Fe transport
MRWTKAVEVRVAVWHLDQHSEGFPDDSGGERLAVIRDLERRDDVQTGVSMRVAGRSDDWTWSGSADFARFDAGVASPGVAPGVRDPQGLPASVDDTRLERTRVGFIVERPTGDWTISGGADAQRERGSDDAVLDFGFFQLPAGFTMDRDRVGAFIEGVGKLGGPVTASAGLRIDHFDDGNSHATARVGLLGEVTQYTQWRINAGTGFKPPSFFALAHPLVGNPDLKAERSETIDAGARHVFSEGRGLIDASVFTSRLHNGVDFDPGPPPRVANIAEIRTRGAELAASWRPGSAWDLFSSLTYMDARSEPDGARMRSRPHWRVGAGVRWLPREDLSALLRLTAVDRIPDSSIPTGDVWLPGWVRVDVSLRWQATDQIAIHVACDNLFDERYEEAVGFASPERRVRIGLQARF